MSEIFDQERVRKFVQRASHGKNLGRNKLFDIDNPSEAELEDITLGLFTEYSDKASSGDLKKLKIAAGYVTRTIDDRILSGMHNALRHGDERVEQIGTGAADLTYNIAGVAARSLRDRIAESGKAAQQPKEKMFETSFLEQETNTVIRKLLEVGIISPNRAASVLAYFRLEPHNQDGADYKKLMDDARRDLERRLQTIAKDNKDLRQSRGMQIVGSYMKRRDQENISMTLEDVALRKELNEALVHLYRIKKDELAAPTMLRSERSKYENSMTPIEGFDD